MKKKSTLLICSILLLLLFYVLIFAFCIEINLSVVISVLFTTVSVGAVLFFVIRKSNSATKEDVFLSIPTIMISIFYIIAEIVATLLIALFSISTSVKNALIINLIIILVSWILIIATSSSNSYIKKVKNEK